MIGPRDQNASATTGMVRVARIFSNVVSPPIMFAALGLAVGLANGPTFWAGFGWAALYGLLISLAPILFVLWMLRTGRISELHMSDTGERHLPYLVAAGCAALVWLLLSLLNGPEDLRCLAAFNLIELVALGLINVVWLISIHATGMIATTILAGLIFGAPAGWALTPLLILVCWARLYLRRHTPAQVLAGLALGAVVILPLLQFGCF
jgi:membrane-associated phospholipid phosphatase